MAVPAWIQTAQGDLIPLGPSPLLKISRAGNSLILTHADGNTTNYPYESPDAAATAMNSYIAVTEARAIGDPEIHAVTPAAIEQSTLPQGITVTGVNFANASAVIVLRNYAGTTILVTVFVTSTTLTATVPNTVLVGTYDVLYSDSNGKVAEQASGFQAY